MKKTLLYLSIVLFSGFIYSCSNDDQNSPELTTMKDIEVVRTGDYMINTRVNIPESDYDLPVLKFKNGMVYSQTLQRVKEMDIEKRIDLFEELGFDGAYTMLRDADNELDVIFDIEDDSEFMSTYDEYKAKYSYAFTFNDLDSYDLSPYLTFSDDDLELLGNINGYVIIGEQIITPSKKEPTYFAYINDDDFEEVGDGAYVKNEIITRNNFPSETEPEFKGFRGVTAMIKQGKYQSTMAIGYDDAINFRPIMVRFASQKKKKLWKRRHNSTHSARVGLPSGTYPAISPAPCSVDHRDLPVPLSALGKKATIQMINFTSGCCDRVKRNETFTVNLPYN